MHTVSIRRMSSSRATTAAGTSPPRVIATMPFHGPPSISRQASALALRCSSSHDTGKVLVISLGMADIDVAPSDRFVRRLGQDAAVDPPGAVRLALHEIEGHRRRAVGADQEDALHQFAALADQLAELHFERPVDRAIAGPPHLPEDV